MPDQTIKCPNCGEEIPLTETLYLQVEEKLRKDYENKTSKKELELSKREQTIVEELKRIEESKKSVEKLVEEKLKKERDKLKLEVRKEAEESLKLELKDLQEQNDEKNKKLNELQKNELDIRKKMRELEDQKQNLELEVTRKLDAEREKIKQSALELFSEEHRHKDHEKDKKISDMLKTIEELKRKAEQGSMQTQGEVLELDLEELLKTTFPFDEITPVPKGMRGADILQKVFDQRRQYCGTIVWETKRTKTWSDGWITKLKDDQREVKAELAVIVSEALPKDINSFAQMDGVWVSDFKQAANLAAVLRVGLIQVSQTRLSAVGKNEKMEILYNYLSGPEFRQKIEAIASSFKSMKAELEQEKTAMTRIWAKREKQIDRVISNTVGMYGDMQGIIGASLQQIKMLELPAEDEGD